MFKDKMVIYKAEINVLRVSCFRLQVLLIQGSLYKKTDWAGYSYPGRKPPGVWGIGGKTLFSEQ